jgi:ketosteroid isomerase-like protein
VATPLEEIDLVRANPRPGTERQAVIHLGDRILTLDRSEAGDEGGTLRRIEDGQLTDPEWYSDRTEALDAANLHGVDSEMAAMLGRQTEGWYRRDIGMLTSILTEDAEIHADPQWPEQSVYRGTEAIRQWYADFFAVMGFGRHVVVEARRSGDIGILHSRQEVAGAASGVPLINEFSNLLHLRGGLTRRIQFFLDREEAEKAFAEAVAG